MVLATIDEALKMDQGPFHLDKDALERVKEATKNGRNDYYRSRLGGFESREIQVAKDVVQSIRRGDGDAIESARRGLERAMCKEADGNVAKALVREMTCKGMLRIDGQGRYTEGIPSFCDWLLAPPETTRPGKVPGTAKTFLWKVGFRNDDGTRHEYTIESTSAPGAVEKLLVTEFADDIGREPPRERPDLRGQREVHPEVRGREAEPPCRHTSRGYGTERESLIAAVQLTEKARELAVRALSEA